MTELAWYVIRTATNREKQAVESLVELGWYDLGQDGGEPNTGFPELYMPRETRWKRTPTTKDKIKAPLFPGYFFIQCAPGMFEKAEDAFCVHDFIRYINSAGEPLPMPVPDKIIAGMQAEEARGVYDKTRPSKRERAKAERRAHGFKTGQRVKVIEGAYAGFIGEVLKMTSRNRKAVVEGRLGVLTLEAEMLEEVEKAA